MRIEKILSSIIEELNPRQKEIITGRFGLFEQKPQTLAAIGKKYNLTRERIRQIENASLNIIREKIKANSECQNLLNQGEKIIKNSGGIIKEENFITELSKSYQGLNRNHLLLILEATSSFNFYENDKDFWSFYHLDKDNLGQLQKFNTQLVKFLKVNKESVLDGNYFKLLKDFMSQQKVNESHAENYIGVSKKIHSNPWGDTGLAEWPEIKPLNIKDKIYLVLKKNEKPLHFENITSEINKTKFDERPALAPTVHNELIKDDRFVLVGRGIYGLKEHGFRPGTVQEVIRYILKENGPMKAKEISTAIAKEKIVKPNTVLVNLQNRKFFERLDNGTYRIRQD